MAFLIAPSETIFEQEGAVILTVGNPAPTPLDAVVLIAPPNPAGTTNPQRTPLVVFG